MLGWFRSDSNVPEPWSPCDYQLRVRVSERLSFLRIGLGWAEDAARRMPLLQHAMPKRMLKQSSLALWVGAKSAPPAEIGRCLCSRITFSIQVKNRAKEVPFRLFFVRFVF